MSYFKNPGQAVELIKHLLLSSDWYALASYYDLHDSDDLERSTLTSGDFFIRKTRPDSAHPAGFWKYKNLFPPQYSYLSHRSLSDELIEVIVHIEIDEGGGMIQEGLQSFHLRKSSNGYQLLPELPGPPDLNNAADTIPVSIQPSILDIKPPWEK